jgi:hypothetical protein
VIVLIVAVCVGGPIVEIFDHWDNTAQEGQNTEAEAVIVAQPQRIPFVDFSPGRFDRLGWIDPPNPNTSPPVALRI